jgi:hypothetical protein
MKESPHTKRLLNYLGVDFDRDAVDLAQGLMDQLWGYL